MTNRDFFRILIKIIGLYFFIQIIFGVLPSQISFLNYDAGFGIFFSIFVIVSLILAVFYFLIRYPEKIIDLFKLDKNFDNEKISVNNFNAKNIITISVFIIGIFLFIENISSLIIGLYQELKKSNNPLLSSEENDSLNLVFTALNVVLGCILIVYRKNISDYFEK